VLQLGPTSADLTVTADPPVAGERLVYLVTGGSGDSDLFVTITYVDDSTQEATIHCDDWFDDDPPRGLGNVLRSGLLTPVIDKLDRIHLPSSFEDQNDAAIFTGEILLQAPARRIKEIVFHPSHRRSAWTQDRCRFNLFGLWVAAGGVTFEAPDAATTAITLGVTPGPYRFRLVVDDGDLCTGPQAEEFTVTLLDVPAFTRGDANADGRQLELTDAVYLLQYLFANGPEPPCHDAGDANDDNRNLDLGDPLFVLQYLFRNGPRMPPPFPDCGMTPRMMPSPVGASRRATEKANRTRRFILEPGTTRRYRPMVKGMSPRLRSGVAPPSSTLSGPTL
jgi:hypothetical protein